ncbi:MAG TPA: S46 family peptidase [Candidatus Saccharimonadales bacterium]|nr:S46 family peptidase [Candidatus Saccharimonadales bacterium]
MNVQRTLGFLGLTSVCFAFNFATRADEGMWLFNDPPRKMLKDRYQFEATDQWLEHVQKSSVRFNSGGSGSFVSEDGLVMSNHHVGSDTLQKVSDKEHDYLKNGFSARSLQEEIPAKDLELNVLINIEDVTSRVNAAIKPGLSDEESFKARRGVIASIEKESRDKTGLRSDVVTLYQGGLYHLYRYKRYTDVRLVFAPEQQIAFYGGDPDNFEYPRYDLDICFFRAYENGKPARIEHYFKWSQKGTSADDLVFVSGHPGRTSRLLTMAELEYARDHSLPTTLQHLHRLEVLLEAYSSRSKENARRAKRSLFGVRNSRKAITGKLAGLLDPVVMERKAGDERKLREAVMTREDLQEARRSWQRIAEAQAIIGANAIRYNLLEGGSAFNSELFGIARTLLRAAEERSKPNGERLREFTEAGRESLELGLFSGKPIYNDFEEMKLADSLTYLVEEMGATNQLVRAVLAGKSPRERATELVQGTKVADIALRKTLYQNGSKGLQESKDPLIELARMVDQPARDLRKIIDTQGEVKQQAHAKIGKARFALQGTSTYPDATFTLRLAFGTVTGYHEGGKSILPHTIFRGLYERAAEQENRPPFDLPKIWLDRKSKLDLKTPFDMVCTADIIGGNSGSPTIDRKGELVGIIFDGNIQSLVLDYIYTDNQARAVSVDSRGIMEALRKVYRADDLVAELSTGKRGK